MTRTQEIRHECLLQLYGSKEIAISTELIRKVAKREGLVLMPFLLDGVAGIGPLNQADGVHPNPAGAKIVAANVWKSIAPLVKELLNAR